VGLELALVLMVGNTGARKAAELSLRRWRLFINEGLLI